VGTGDRSKHTDPGIVARSVAGQGRSVPELSRELDLAFADEPQVVVCDLRAAPLARADAAALFTPVIDYLSCWPGAGLVVACAEYGEVKDGLKSLPEVAGLNGLVIASSPGEGLAELRGRLPLLERSELHLEGELTAPRVARSFTTRAMLDWHLTPLIGPASVVVSELVTNSVVHTGTDIDLTLTRAGGRMQIRVRDYGKGSPVVRLRRRRPDHHLEGRGLILVQAVSRRWGVFPAQPDGKTVWAVLDET